MVLSSRKEFLDFLASIMRMRGGQVYVTCRISSPGMKRNQARHGASSSGGVRFGVLTSRWISQGYRDKHCSWPQQIKRDQ